MYISTFVQRKMADEEDEDGQTHIFISTPYSGAVLKDGMAPYRVDVGNEQQQWQLTPELKVSQPLYQGSHMMDFYPKTGIIDASCSEAEVRWLDLASNLTPLGSKA